MIGKTEKQYVSGEREKMKAKERRKLVKTKSY